MADDTVTQEPESGAADNDTLLHDALTGYLDGNERVETALGLDRPADDAGTEPTEEGEGGADDTDAEAPVAEAEDAETSGSTAPEPTPEEADPFTALTAGAKPLTYKVNGTERTFDGILEVEGKGALIPAEKVAEVRQMLSRYESNAAASKDLYGFKQQVERLGGVTKFHEMSERVAMTDAASVLILNAVTQNPAQFVNPDGSPNTERINFLIQQAGVQAERARYEVRDQREKQATEWQAEASAEEMRDTALPNAIAQAAQSFGLGAEDVAAAQAHFGPLASALYFKATPEQALQWGVTPGTLMIDLPKMEPWFRDRATMRRDQATDAKKREDAAKHNAAVQKAPAQPRNRKGEFTKTPKQQTTTQQSKPSYTANQLARMALSGKALPGFDDED